MFSIEVDGAEHRYRAGLKESLDNNNGVYVFYDSRGHAIYAGKAVGQSLWKEMNLAFNRERGDLQMIRRVAHPTRNEEYRPAGEVDRQIRDETVLLSELAEYFSAYRVTDGFIGEVESLLVRAFANDLLNKRMEKFDVQRNGR